MIGIRNILFGTVLSLLSQAAIAQEWVYTIRPGDTLWDIIDKYSVNLIYVPRLQALNNVENPKRLQPGSTLRIPVEWLKFQPISVSAINIIGEVDVLKQNSSISKKLNIGDTLVTGDSVTTGQDGNAVFLFADGSQLILRRDSHLIFDTLSQFGEAGMIDTRARLQHGNAEAEVAKMKGGGNRYEIHTPAATTAVRGTGYRISADTEQSLTRTEVLEGKVDVSSHGALQSVPEGYGTVTKQDSPPSPPIALLHAPDISELPSVIERLPFNLKWKTLDGAISYHYQIAADDKFDVLIEDKQTEQAEAAGISIPNDGEYVLRIRGLDENGLEGRDAHHSFILNAFPEPPYLIMPEPDQVIRTDSPSFQWSKPQSANSFNFQLSKNIEFDSRLIDEQSVVGTSFKSAEPLQPGKYYWRLATRDHNGEVGPFSDSGSFTYTPPPPGPEPEPPSVDSKNLTLSWPAGKFGQTFRLQVSRTADFKKLLVEENLEESKFSMKRPRFGTYYIRVSVVDVDGLVGEFGNPQEFSIPFNFWLESGFGVVALTILLLL